MKRTWAFPSKDKELYRLICEDNKCYWIWGENCEPSLYNESNGESMEVNGICEEIKE